MEHSLSAVCSGLPKQTMRKDTQLCAVETTHSHTYTQKTNKDTNTRLGWCSMTANVQDKIDENKEMKEIQIKREATQHKTTRTWTKDKGRSTKDTKETRQVSHLVSRQSKVCKCVFTKKIINCILWSLTSCLFISCRNWLTHSFYPSSLLGMHIQVRILLLKGLGASAVES